MEKAFVTVLSSAMSSEGGAPASSSVGTFHRPVWPGFLLSPSCVRFSGGVASIARILAAADSKSKPVGLRFNPESRIQRALHATRSSVESPDAISRQLTETYSSFALRANAGGCGWPSEIAEGLQYLSTCCSGLRGSPKGPTL
jgi:hypothetical protein